jgi:hypothetical protein
MWMRWRFLIATRSIRLQGDLVVTFIDLINEARIPIVLYRPASAATDLGLYGSSHVGILGGIIKPTNIEGILQLDLLKTDYFHAKAYPTYLYYNPHTSVQTVEIDVGSEACDIYDAVGDELIQNDVRGVAHFTIPADAPPFGHSTGRVNFSSDQPFCGTYH